MDFCLRIYNFDFGWHVERRVDRRRWNRWHIYKVSIFGGVDWGRYSKKCFEPDNEQRVFSLNITKCDNERSSIEGEAYVKVINMVSDHLNGGVILMG